MIVHTFQKGGDDDDKATDKASDDPGSIEMTDRGMRSVTGNSDHPDVNVL